MAGILYRELGVSLLKRLRYFAPVEIAFCFNKNKKERDFGGAKHFINNRLI
jgi:hypothetical protein